MDSTTLTMTQQRSSVITNPPTKTYPHAHIHRLQQPLLSINVYRCHIALQKAKADYPRDCVTTSSQVTTNWRSRVDIASAFESTHRLFCPRKRRSEYANESEETCSSPTPFPYPMTAKRQITVKRRKIFIK